MNTNDSLEQSQALNGLLIEMVKNQKDNMKTLVRIFIVTIVCYTLLLISAVIGFFVYESQFEITEKVVTETTTTTTQEVSGENSEINNVEGNMYKDNATHNEGN